MNTPGGSSPTSWSHSGTGIVLGSSLDFHETGPGFNMRILNKHMHSSIIKYGLNTYLPWARGLGGAGQTDVTMTKLLPSGISQSSEEVKPKSTREQPEQKKSGQKLQSERRHGGERWPCVSMVVSWLEQLQP